MLFTNSVLHNIMLRIVVPYHTMYITLNKCKQQQRSSSSSSGRGSFLLGIVLVLHLHSYIGVGQKREGMGEDGGTLRHLRAKDM